MADGFSLVWDVETVGAIIAGLEPDWRAYTNGIWDEPPEQTLWNS